jgi:hypothetical protein
VFSIMVPLFQSQWVKYAPKYSISQQRQLLF